MRWEFPTVGAGRWRHLPTWQVRESLKSLRTSTFSDLARLLLSNGQGNFANGVNDGSAADHGRPAASGPHHSWRVRGDRRGFRLQPRCFLRVPFAAIVLWSPTDRDRRLTSRSARSCLARACCSRRRRRQLRAAASAGSQRGQRATELAELRSERLNNRRGLRRALRADRTGRGAGAAAARRRRPARARWRASPTLAR